MNERCHCGKPLHYTCTKTEQLMKRIVQQFGPYVRMTTPDGTWLVQRHYVALHGLKAWALPHLGFEKVNGNPRDN